MACDERRYFSILFQMQSVLNYTLHRRLFLEVKCLSYHSIVIGMQVLVMVDSLEIYYILILYSVIRNYTPFVIFIL